MKIACYSCSFEIANCCAVIVLALVIWLAFFSSQHRRSSFTWVKIWNQHFLITISKGVFFFSVATTLSWIFLAVANKVCHFVHFFLFHFKKPGIKEKYEPLYNFKKLFISRTFQSPSLIGTLVEVRQNQWQTLYFLLEIGFEHLR